MSNKEGSSLDCSLSLQSLNYHIAHLWAALMVVADIEVKRNRRQDELERP